MHRIDDEQEPPVRHRLEQVEPDGSPVEHLEFGRQVVARCKRGAEERAQAVIAQQQVADAQEEGGFHGLSVSRNETVL